MDDDRLSDAENIRNRGESAIEPPSERRSRLTETRSCESDLSGSDIVDHVVGL